MRSELKNGIRLSFAANRPPAFLNNHSYFQRPREY